MYRDKPLVSIGIPTYNGSLSIERSLLSILHQDYQNIELIISDDNSKDNTVEICANLLKRYSNLKNIKYNLIINKINKGANHNFNKLLELSNGEYFCWHAQDDIREHNYISKCVEQFLLNDNLVYCHSNYANINYDNTCINSKIIFNNLKYILDQKNIVHRFFFAYKLNIGSTAFYGLMKKKALKETFLWENFIGSDICIFNSIILKGDSFCLDQILFKYSSRSTVRSVSQHFLFMDPLNTKINFFPSLIFIYKNLNLILYSPIDINSKFYIIIKLFNYEFTNVIFKFIFKFLKFFNYKYAEIFLNIIGRTDLLPMKTGYEDER